MDVLDLAFPPEECEYEENADHYVRTGSWLLNVQGAPMGWPAYAAGAYMAADTVLWTP